MQTSSLDDSITSDISEAQDPACLAAAVARWTCSIVSVHRRHRVEAGETLAQLALVVSLARGRAQELQDHGVWTYWNRREYLLVRRWTQTLPA